MESQEHITQTKQDHDLLVRIDERLTGLSADFVDFKNKLIPQFMDYETRIRSLEKAKWTWGGMVTVLATGLSWFVNWMFR